MHRLPLALLALLPALAARAADAPEKAAYSGKTEMNGLRLADYEGFEKKWKLVTVRFRRDTNELRFTYANDAAWEALRAGVKEYPKGAVFAKIGLMTKDDPSFTSSAVPSGVRRFQLMVRDPARYADTGGWGYALFDAGGKTFPEEPKLQAVACHACHRLVPEKNFVFSEPVDLSTSFLEHAAEPSKPKISTSHVKFREAPAAKHAALAKELAGFPRVFLLESEMSRHLFQGTLDEVKPVLAAQAAKTGTPAALLSSDGKRFSLVLPAKDGACAQGEAAMTAVFTTVDAQEPVRRLPFCFHREQ